MCWLRNDVLAAQQTQGNAPVISARRRVHVAATAAAVVVPPSQTNAQIDSDCVQIGAGSAIEGPKTTQTTSQPRLARVLGKHNDIISLPKRAVVDLSPESGVHEPMQCCPHSHSGI